MSAPAPVILVFGLQPERLVDAEGRIDAFLEAPSQEQVEILVEAVSSGLEAAGAVIAIVPTWFAPAGLQRLQMVHSILDTERVALHPTPLPPLAATVLASVASSMGPHLAGAGVLASLLPELEAELHVVTWLGSVSGLDTPTPTLGQHMASLMPGSSFGVSSWPQPSVHRIRAGSPSVPLPQIQRPSRLAIAPRSDDAGWIRGPVNAALGGLPVREIGPTPNGPSWWGTQKLVEGVAYPVDVAELAEELTSEIGSWVCRWCRELVARTPCPLCGHRGRPVRRRAAAG